MISRKARLFSLLAVALFLVSMNIGTGGVTSHSKPAERSRSYTIYPDSGYTEAQDEPENGTYVWWQQDEDTYADEWSWENRNWLFGPSPSFKVYHENGTELTGDSWAEIGEELTVVITVPKSVFAGGPDIGSVHLNGWYMTADWNFSANFDMSWRWSSWEWEENWHSWSSWYNHSEHAVVPPDTSFLDLHGDQCTNTTDGERHIISFVVSFREHTPIGLYQLDMWVEDRDYNWIGSYNYGSGWEFNGIAVGIPPDEAWSWSWGGSYTLEKLDMDGDLLYSVSRSKDFKMRFNISGDTPDYVTLGFRIPSGMNKLVTETGWHEEIKTKDGGWVYDDALDTYVWDPDIEVTYTEHVFGEFETYRWIDLGTSRRVNVTRRGYSWWTGEYPDEQYYWDPDVVYNETWWVDSLIWYVWNSTTYTFDTFYGYRTWGYTGDYYWNGTHYKAIGYDWNDEITVFEPIPEDLPNFYELNDTLSFAGEVGREFIVEFVGQFTEEMPKTEQYSGFRFEDEVMGPDGYRYGPNTHGEKPKQTWQEYELAKEITIESPVTIAKLLNEDGTRPYGWVFQANPNENFMVKGRLQGGGDLADDIDGAQIELNTYDGFWSENESRYSHIIYEIVVNMTGYTFLKAFNMTEKRNWTYGVYEDWIYTNSTGWHYEYDEESSDWEWIYGEYWDWMWMEMEGWHWEWWYFNQLTQEWQQNWLHWRSIETEVPSDFCTISEFTSWTEGGDLYASFLVNMSDTVPETNYWWEFNFLNNTWYTDHSSEYGEHEVMTWDREWVYSFEYEDEQVYMDPIVNNQLAFYNDTLCTNEGSDYLFGEESPYIVIGDEYFPIVVRENYDWWSGNTWTNIFFYDHWDPETNKDYYYYQLTNDTKILVTYSESMYIYNVTLGTGESFLTGQDYHRHHRFNETYWVYYWIDIYGNIYQGEYWEDYARYSDNVTVVQYDNVEWEYNPDGYIVKYGEDSYLNITDWWWESIDQSYYLTDFDGTLYQMIYNDSYGVWEYQIFIDGNWVNVDWPFHYYTAEYEDETVFLFTYSTHRFWYHERGDVKHEMPYPGAHAEWWHDMEHTVSDGGKVPTTKSVWYEGLLHPVYNVTDGETEWFVDIGLDTFHLILGTYKYSTANGTDIWDPVVVGYSGRVGTYDENFIFEETELVDFASDHPKYHYSHWIEWNETGRHIVLRNDTIWLVNETEIRMIYEYDLDGTSFYSFDDWPRYWEQGNESGYFHYALNGTMVNMTDWEKLPVLNTYMVDTYRNYSSNDYYFEFMSVEYERCWGWGQTIYTYKIFNATYSGDLYLDSQYGWFQEIYQFNYKDILANATASLDNIYKLRKRWGHNLVYGPTPIEGVVYKNYYDLVIGNPDWGLWDLKNWVVNEDTGALDLDGDLETTEDQYYVKEIYNSTQTYNHTWSWMGVSLEWDPNGTIWGDEMHIYSWMGLDTFTWSYTWEQSFEWYHADESITRLTSTEMEEVQEIILSEDGEPQPGYWGIAWMAVNTTWEDILAEAEEQGWDWISSNEQTWTWLSFGVSQEYGTSVLENEVEHWINIGMRYEYSGLMLWEDLNENSQMDLDLNDPGQGELSHYFIPDSVADVNFVTPGMGFGDFSTSGNFRANLTDEVTWGVAFTSVNGTVFPFTTWGYWGWYDSVVAGTDMIDFDDRPTKVTIDELSFLVHFQGFVNDTGDTLNNYAHLKVDNYVGNWDIDMIGGRENIENKSLALNYYADVHLSDWWSVDADGMQAGNDQTVSAETFEFLRGEAPFAEMIMGGVTYDWSKNTTARYNVTSSTTPIGAFRAAFESEGGQSATTWAFSSTQYYLTIGFPQWGGYSVYQDPVFVAYVSGGGSTGGDLSFGALSIEPNIPQPHEDVQIGIDITTSEQINWVKVMYTTDFVTWEEVWMWNTHGDHWEAYIPGYEDDTTVYFKFVVNTNISEYESGTSQYTVGESVGPTTGPTTGPTSPGPGPIGGDMIVLLGGGALVIIILVVLAKRRKSASYSYTV